MIASLCETMSFVPHLTVLSQIGFTVVAVTGVLYLLSRMPELLLVGAISLIYAAVPLIH